MIELNLSNWVTALLAAHVLLLLALSVGYGLRDWRRQPRRRRDRLYRCRDCGSVYPEQRELPLARCPGCGTMNEALRTMS